MFGDYDPMDLLRTDVEAFLARVHALEDEVAMLYREFQRDAFSRGRSFAPQKSINAHKADLLKVAEELLVRCEEEAHLHRDAFDRREYTVRFDRKWDEFMCRQLQSAHMHIAEEAVFTVKVAIDGLNRIPDS